MRRIACLLVHESTAAPSASRELLLGVALAHSPRVEEGGADHVYLDATGLRGLFGSEEQLARRLVAAGGERGQRVRVGIAGSRISARFACRLHEGITVVEPEDDAAYLAPAPVALLDLPPEMATRLDRWGIRTLGELAALPPAALFERLGGEGPRLQQLARGEDPRPLRPWAPPPILEETAALDDAVEALGPLVELLATLAERISDQLARHGRSADQFEWVCHLADRRRHEGSCVPAVPLSERAAVTALLRASLEAHPPSGAVVAVTLRARPVRVPAAQTSLGDPSRPSPRLVTATLARLAALVGAQQIGVPVPLDSHRPDAVELAPYQTPDAFPEAYIDQHSGTGEGVRAALALRRFRPPLPASVTLVAGRPVELRSRRLAARIVISAGPWRVSGEWWTERPWLHDEWDVELGEGVICRLTQDGSAWWLDGIYD
jgi:protein ImuB